MRGPGAAGACAPPPCPAAACDGGCAPVRLKSHTTEFRPAAPLPSSTATVSPAAFVIRTATFSFASAFRK